jgi:hypothetical protein
MIITKRHLPRRAVLRGLGATIALPLLDAMIPAARALRLTAAAPVRRLGVVYVGNGQNMSLYTPRSEGPLELSSVLEPLAPFQDRVLVASGLDSMRTYRQDGGPHPRAQTTYLTGMTPKRTEGRDIEAGISMDQIAARQFEKETQLASLELALESTDLLGVCSLGYSCAYNNTIAWRTPTTPLPMENNPRAVFERLFGASDSTDRKTRLADIHKDRSLLDSVTEEVTRLNRRVGPSDRSKVTDYLESIRDIERRIQKAEQQVDQELPVVAQPVGIPTTFEQHVRLMFDLSALAYQCDLTRVITFVMARELSTRAYPEIGVSEPHHPLSHHGDDPEKLARLAKISTFHMHQFAYFLERLRSTPEGDGSLLDQSLLLYGGGMSNPNLHDHLNLPTVIVAGKSIGITTGRHVRFPKGTPWTNMQVTLLDKVGVRVDHFGDSTGILSI